MAEYLIQDTTLTAIADAIRSKTGESGQVAVADMAEKISGIAVDEKVETTVALNFSEGDMQLTPEDGKVFSSINIPAPATLIPENIAEGVDIAGIVGTLIGGTKKEIKYAKGTIAAYNTSDVTVAHGLGVTPDIIIMRATGSFITRARNEINFYIGLSSAFSEAIGGILCCAADYVNYKTTVSSTYAYNLGRFILTSTSWFANKGFIDATSGGDYSIVREANAETFVSAYQTTIPYTRCDATAYDWIAIGGLT